MGEEHLILKNISRHISLTNQEKSYFLSLLKEKKVAKKELILQQQQSCKEINFVQTGILRAFHMDTTGKESTIMFAISDWWITDMYCFINQKPAMLNIEALEDSSVLQLQKDHLDNLYHKVPKFERFFRIMMQNAYIREQLRTIENLSLPAEERYYNFLQKYPEAVKRIRQKQIASYLGITPEFLSLIKSKQKNISS
ncbi:cAMP-binding domain of CRP or a regulatory subunit of cAMP-dependent protein kinases [Chryseobacterium rhizoplanae]|uniref:cAMP-binding domain of CRP or a regulatory subunit of cAMP-dependent protein kinases n=1 Tax=Chryseobacterium rhizoplanae TaxID=1609531 RepID=A0A521D432_9FLAO|nr:Crp/Fnr family transcriptional regulator [Chryseobacterium rhizoplanae]SMO66463.1 cAMP-binding domain of CRP or a regulatory subunit of cAMP-dependent protein kinases [Chryseobacterium rhizoplanae]